MAPAAPLGTYARYKAATKQFECWITKTAEQMGYPKSIHRRKGPDSRNPSFEEKGKKGSNINNESVAALCAASTPVNMYLALARYIKEQDPNIEIGPGVLENLEDAIEFRKRHGAQVEQRLKDKAKNESHRHFIGILEQI